VRLPGAPSEQSTASPPLNIQIVLHLQENISLFSSFILFVTTCTLTVFSALATVRRPTIKLRYMSCLNYITYGYSQFHSSPAFYSSYSITPYCSRQNILLNLASTELKRGKSSSRQTTYGVHGPVTPLSLYDQIKNNHDKYNCKTSVEICCR